MPLSPYPWVSLFVLSAVPILVTSNSGPGWLINWPRATCVWILLALVAAAALVRGPWFASRAHISISGVAVFTAPLLQAVLFVILYRVFGVLAHRLPASFNAVQYWRRGETQSYVIDRIFWVVTLLTIFVAVLLVSFHVGVEFPTRHRFR